MSTKRKPLEWTDHEVSGTDGLTVRVAHVDVSARGGVSMHVHRDADAPAQGWRYDVEIDALLEPGEDCADEATARQRAHAAALAWAEKLVAELKAVQRHPALGNPRDVRPVTGGSS